MEKRKLFPLFPFLLNLFKSLHTPGSFHTVRYPDFERRIKKRKERGPIFDRITKQLASIHRGNLLSRIRLVRMIGKSEGRNSEESDWSRWGAGKSSRPVYYGIRRPIVPRDTLFNYELRGAERMEGNSDEPFSLQCPLEPKLASIRAES